MTDPARPVMGPEPPPAPDAAEPPAVPMSAGGPLGSSALFWGDGDDIDPDNPDMAALLALQEECTPEERAEAFKVQGNEAVKRGSAFYQRQAAAFYTQAIEQRSGNAEQNSVYYANRAHTQLQLRNWGKALSDARAAVALNAANVKACFRGAKAAAELGKHADVLELCAQGLQTDAANTDLQRLQAAARAAQAAASATERRVVDARETAERVADALEARDIHVGPPIFGGRSHKPALDDEGRLSWRMVLVYPESNQTDLVELVGEDDTLAEFLDGMFGPDAPPLPWDAAGAYHREALEAYYQTDLVKPYSAAQLRSWLCEGTPAGVGAALDDDGADDDAAAACRALTATAAQRVRVDEHAPLRDVMAAPAHVIPSTLVLFIVARDTPGKQRFLAGRW